MIDWGMSISWKHSKIIDQDQTKEARRKKMIIDEIKGAACLNNNQHGAEKGRWNQKAENNWDRLAYLEEEEGRGQAGEGGRGRR